MGLCDICNKPLGINTKHYSALKMKTAVQAGAQLTMNYRQVILRNGRPCSTRPIVACTLSCSAATNMPSARRYAGSARQHIAFIC
jgi:hypothetical protein